MTADRRTAEVRTKGQALSRVADHLAGYLDGIAFEDLASDLGLPAGSLTGAEVARLAWAAKEVSRRLRLMGGSGASAGATGEG